MRESANQQLVTHLHVCGLAVETFYDNGERVLITISEPDKGKSYISIKRLGDDVSIQIDSSYGQIVSFILGQPIPSKEA